MDTKNITNSGTAPGIGRVCLGRKLLWVYGLPPSHLDRHSKTVYLGRHNLQMIKNHSYVCDVSPKGQDTLVNYG
jgi:hypothetical protein